MDKFRPQSPDPFIVEDEDMYLARLGHLNALVDVINSTLAPISGSGVMYQSQYDPFNTGIVSNSYLLNSQPATYYLDRANHSGTQDQSTITGLVTDLALKGDMFKIVYDTLDNGVVNDSRLLEGFPGSYYLDMLNFTGLLPQASVVNLVADLASKVDDTEVGVSIATLVGGLVPLAQLPFAATAYLGLYNGATNTPLLTNGVGIAGQFVITSVAGAAGPAGAVILNQIVAYNGAIWEAGPIFTAGISSVNGNIGPVVVIDLDDIPDTPTRAAVLPVHAQGLAASFFPISAANPVVSQQALTNLNVVIATKGDMFKSTYDTNNNGIVDNSDRLSNQTGAYYRNRVNHTGFQPQSSVTNLVTDLALKEDKANKGVANGYCDLDAGGKVPLARLNLAALNYQNSWNAFSNQPVLADGVGAAGDAYLVGVAGTRNLGSGSVSYAVGDLVVYNGTTWQKITSTPVGVSSWNGLVGSITATTANLPESAGFRYVTDAQNAALDNSNNPSALNPYITQLDLDSAEADITDIQGDIVTINANLALKENKSEKGIALGYAPLNASTKIDPIYLPASVFSYQNSWNALTNTPALADGVGTSGDAYIVGTAGSQNLGSGLISFIVGDLVIYNGTIWQKITGAAPGVSSVNGFTGAVTLTAANIAETASRFYVNANQNAALDAASSASGVNRFATMADIASPPAIPFVTPQQYGAINANSTFASLGITQPTIDATYPGIGALTTDTVDWAATQYAANQAILQNKPFQTYGTYYINRAIVITPTAYEYNFVWKGGGADFITTNNNSFVAISIGGYPTSYSGAPLGYNNASILIENLYDVSDIRLHCQSAQTGFYFGPSYDSHYHKLSVADANIGILLRFNLQAKVSNCNVRRCQYAYRVGTGAGLWTSNTPATTSNTQCNVTTFDSCRAQCNVTAEIGFDIVDSNSIVISDCILEGAKFKKGVNFFSQLTTVNNLTIRNLHYECVNGTGAAGSGEAVVYSRILGGTLLLENLYGQYASILADTGLSAGGAWTTVLLQNMVYWIPNAGKALYNVSNTSYVFTNNDNIFFGEAATVALVAGTPISLCGGVGCGNNKYYFYRLPR